MAKEIRKDGRKTSRKHKFEVTVMFKHGRNLCHRSFIVWAYMLHDAVTELELFDDDVKALEREGWRIHEMRVSRTPVLVRIPNKQKVQDFG